MVTAMGNLVVLLLAALYVYILVLEMFLWDKPQGRKAFGLSQEFATQTKTLGANQGLYNGFLAAGLFWGLIPGEAGLSVKVFFLVCILVAGVYGGLTASKKIIFIQAVPATVGLLLLGIGTLM